jgi:hypothetical protein
MFDLVKNGDIWTLSYRKSRFSAVFGAVFLTLCLVSTVVPIVRLAQNSSGAWVPGVTLIMLALFGLAAYRVLNDSDSDTEFNLTRRRLTVDCKRPWFGAPRSFDFADVAALEMNRQPGDGAVDWAVRIELHDGERILLGVAKAGQCKQFSAYIEGIQGATGIAAGEVDKWSLYKLLT